MESSETLKQYRQHRANGVSARWALHYAKQSPPFEWEECAGGDVLGATVDGFELRATVGYDDYPDVSFRGEFVRDWDPGAIRNPESVHDRGRLDWFMPATTADAHRRELSRMGYARHIADCLARSYVRRDMDAAREPEVLVVTVTASREGVVLGESALYGVDVTGCTWNERRAYLEETAHDIAAEAIAEARDALERLGAAV